MHTIGFAVLVFLGLLLYSFIWYVHRKRKEYLGVTLKVLDVHRDWMRFEEVFMMTWMMRGALTMTKLPEEDMQEGLERVVREFERFRPDPLLLKLALRDLVEYEMAESRMTIPGDRTTEEWRISFKRFKKKKKRRFELPKLNWGWGSPSPVPA